MDWRPIETAPRERWKRLDLWVVNRKTGEGRRYPDARWMPCQGKDAWGIWSGEWVTGRRYYDDEGEDCFDPAAQDEHSSVATHWMPLPAPPKA